MPKAGVYPVKAPPASMAPPPVVWDGVVPPPPTASLSQPAPAKAKAKATMADMVSETGMAAVTELLAMRGGGASGPPAKPPAQAKPAADVKMTPVSLSDSDDDKVDVGGGGSGGGEVKSAQAKKRARRVARQAAEKAIADKGITSTAASSSHGSVGGPGVWTHVIEGVVAGIASIELEVGAGGGGEPVGEGGHAVGTRLCAEASRVTPDPAGEATDTGGATSSGGARPHLDLPITGGGDVDRPQPKTSLWCSKCEAHIGLRQDLLLAPGGLYGLDAEWQSAIWGVCFPCSAMTAAAFKRESKREWQKRGAALGGRVRRFRNMDFNNCSALIAEQLPGAKFSLVRELSFLRLKCCCLALAVALDNENPFSLEARDMSFQVYHDRIVAAAADPAMAAKQDGQVFGATELDYLTSVADGFSVSYVCRRKNCMWFGLNSEWPKDRGSYHFACPCCGFKYVPWKALGDS
jgi:hypothetical protein